MSLTAENITSVTCLTSPADMELDYDGRRLFYPFDVVLAVSSGGRTFGVNPDGISRDRTIEKRELALPTQTAERLTEAARILSWRRFYNCHRFSRVMAGVIAADRLDYPEPSWHYDPPAVYLDELEPVKSLAVGVPGIVGVPYPKPTHVRNYGNRADIPHSVIGLGEDTNESLHIHTLGGLLGIVDNDTLLDFYRGYMSFDGRTDLYQVPTDSLL